VAAALPTTPGRRAGDAAALAVLLDAVRALAPEGRTPFLDRLEAEAGRPVRLYMATMLAAPRQGTRLTPGIQRMLLRLWPPLLPPGGRVVCARALHRALVGAQKREVYLWVRSQGLVTRGHLDPPDTDWPRDLVLDYPWLLDGAVEAARSQWAALARREHALTRQAVRDYVLAVRRALRRSGPPAGPGGQPVEAPALREPGGRLDRLELTFHQPRTVIHVFAGYHSYPPEPFRPPRDKTS
jgi:hypothetical protein